MRKIVTSSDVIDSVLQRYATELGPHAQAYRNHVYRAMNYQLLLLGDAAPSAEVALAWAVHDLGVWTNSWDYIPRSVEHVHELAAEFGITDPLPAAAMVEQHHKIRPAADRRVDAFRRADRTDVTRGLWRGDLGSGDVRRCVEAFPYLGFHKILARTQADWLRRHPLHPAPMMRW